MNHINRKWNCKQKIQPNSFPLHLLRKKGNNMNYLTQEQFLHFLDSVVDLEDNPELKEIHKQVKATIHHLYSNQVQAGVSKPIYIVYEACFQGDNLLTAFEDREDAEKYIKRAKKNYYISKPIHLVKAC